MEEDRRSMFYVLCFYGSVFISGSIWSTDGREDVAFI